MKITMNVATGIVIKAFRQHLSYKQDFVAYKANITVKTLANIENGRVSLSLEKLYQFSLVFGIEPKFILNLAIEVYETNDYSWLQNAVKALKPLPPNNTTLGG